MADDDLRCLFHLTEDGWVRGTGTFFKKVQGKEIPRPEGAVATYQLHVYSRSPWSPEERTWSLVWRREGVTEEEVTRIQEQFPSPNEGR